MTPHSSTLAWKIPWMEEPGRLQSMWLLRVGQDCTTSFSLSCIGEGNGNPLQCSCLENPMDGVAWWAAVYGVTQSWTRLRQLSTSSSNDGFTFLGPLISQESNVAAKKVAFLPCIFLFLIVFSVIEYLLKFLLLLNILKTMSTNCQGFISKSPIFAIFS